ncbi:hypothetical protein WPS_24460 [Vulcanimicrobium alpinum]|uniref:Uncharacterized protein n=1 Tax=Vulcanimicrobium alpinum TaxID=3016050 RepID=A0AAN2CA20_UNVUL|nr:hypothetical protein WPS_24460 [Vulcanimicrobium alpinum]
MRLRSRVRSRPIQPVAVAETVCITGVVRVSESVAVTDTTSMGDDGVCGFRVYDRR